MIGFFITGPPGSGKSTLFFKIIESLRSLGCSVGGIYAPEVREGSTRIGFQLVDLMTGERAWLAKAGAGGSLRVGKYAVLQEAGPFGRRALERALAEANIIGIDEIGPMELMIGELRGSIVRSLSSGKPVVAVIHRRLPSDEPEIFKLAKRLGPIREITRESREEALKEAESIARQLSLQAGCSKRGEGHLLRA